MSDSVQVIVARYLEDLGWVVELGLPRLVYDKSGDPSGGRLPFVRQLPNIGRETHTYLHHIVENYPRFADFNVFLQGNPFAHMEEGAGPAELRRMIDEYVRRRANFGGFAFFKLKCDALGRPHDMKNPSSAGKWAGYGRDIPVGETYASLFDGPVPERFAVKAPSGNFLVSGPRILTRPLAFYVHALRLIESDPKDERNTGHAFERLWYVIFNGYERLNKAHYDAGRLDRNVEGF